MDNNVFILFNRHLLLIIVQMMCSCFAGVYNEFLLKDKGADVHIMIHNIFMYIDSMVCNVIVLGIKGDLTSAFSPDGLKSIFIPVVIGIILNNAIFGIVTSQFLRSLNSIIKVFANSLQLVFLAILCWVIFGIPVDIYSFLAILIVSAATLLYAQKPVVNAIKSHPPQTELNGKSIIIKS